MAVEEEEAEEESERGIDPSTRSGSWRRRSRTRAVSICRPREVRWGGVGGVVGGKGGVGGEGGIMRGGRG